jgi:hypothetical protein
MISYAKNAKALTAKEYMTQQKSSEGKDELAVGVCDPMVLTERSYELLGNCCRRHVTGGLRGCRFNPIFEPMFGSRFGRRRHLSSPIV